MQLSIKSCRHISYAHTSPLLLYGGLLQCVFPFSHNNRWQQKNVLKDAYDEIAGQGAFERDYAQYEARNGNAAPDFQKMFAEPNFREISRWSGRKKAAVTAGVVLALTAAGYVIPSALRGKWNPLQSSWWNFGGSTNKTAGRRRLQGKQWLLRDGTF